MCSQPPDADPAAWDHDLLGSILRELSTIHADMLRLEQRHHTRLAETHESFRESARNLLHYLALRQHDLRGLQEKLARLGLSSLGRTESHALAGLEAVLKIVETIAGDGSEHPSHAPALGFEVGKALLQSHTTELLGPRPAKRGVRIMVTMPSDAACDDRLVRDLLAQGMDVMRINCAHDDRDAWAAMIANLGRAMQELGRKCQVLMDIAGPKLRTGAIDAHAQVVKWRPQRDLYGRVRAPAHVWLTPAEQPQSPPASGSGSLLLPDELLARCRSGDRLRFVDLRGKSRALVLGKEVGRSRWASSKTTAYLAAGAALRITHSPKTGNQQVTVAEVGAPEPAERFILLAAGDTLVLTRAQTPGRPAARAAGDKLRRAATIPCTEPAIFADVRPDERIWFDDGKVGGVISQVTPDEIHVRITSASTGGDKLRADKGINLPDSDLHLPPLTAKDVEDLAFVVQHADMMGFSFVKRPEDILLLEKHLERLAASDRGIVLKIETRSAFERLPNLLLAAMRNRRIGVMIARGDLAVEIGWERLAEAQEEILWICEAAHVPVIWATQVLENLAKKGVPSRAEITDAAMGERAECVMLNKGPHLVEAVRVLEDILRRMEAHQNKKSARLRSLRLSTLP
jgi:pyruvate kinase